MAEELRMQQLVLVSPTTPTMDAHNGRDASVIDLVFVSDVSICSVSSVAEKVPWNTSCHSQVTFSLKIRHCIKKPTKHTKQQQKTLIVKKDYVVKSTFDDIMDDYLFQIQLLHT